MNKPQPLTSEQQTRMLELDSAIKEQGRIIREHEARLVKMLEEIAPLAARAQVGQVILKRAGAHGGKKMRVIALRACFEFDSISVDHLCQVLKADGTDSSTKTIARSYDGIEVQS